MLGRERLRAFARVGDAPARAAGPAEIVVHTPGGKEVRLGHGEHLGRPALKVSLPHIGVSGTSDGPDKLGKPVPQAPTATHALYVSAGDRTIPIALDADNAAKAAAHLAAHPKNAPDAPARLHRERKELVDRLAGASEAAHSAGERAWAREDEGGWSRARKVGAARVGAAKTALDAFDRAHPEIRAAVESGKKAAGTEALEKDWGGGSRHGAVLATFAGRTHIRPAGDVARAALEHGARGGIFVRLPGGGRHYQPR